MRSIIPIGSHDFLTYPHDRLNRNYGRLRGHQAKAIIFQGLAPMNLYSVLRSLGTSQMTVYIQHLFFRCFAFLQHKKKN